MNCSTVAVYTRNHPFSIWMEIKHYFLNSKPQTKKLNNLRSPGTKSKPVDKSIKIVPIIKSLFWRIPNSSINCYSTCWTLQEDLYADIKIEKISFFHTKL